MKWVDEFKTFAVRGNVLDMSVGIIIGGAFGKIVSSLVADVILPPIGMLIGGFNFTEWKLIMQDAVLDAGQIVKPAVTLNIGNFIQTVFDFTIIAVSIFLMIKVVNSIIRKKEKTPESNKQEELLSEIRDLLKNNSQMSDLG